MSCSFRSLAPLGRRGDRARAFLLAALLAAIPGGCRLAEATPHPARLPGGILLSPVCPAASRAWASSQSYYALLEILDAHLDPWTDAADRATVRRFLGAPIDSPDGYPNAGPNLWVYPSSRRVPWAHILLVDFDADGRVLSLDWVSE